MTVQEAAAKLGVSPRTVLMFVDRGVLAGVDPDSVAAMTPDKLREALGNAWAEGQARVGGLIRDFRRMHGEAASGG
jgi:hypothetical protein